MTFKKELSLFKDSFKNLKTNFLFIVFFDLCFYAFFIFTPLFWNKFIMKHPLTQEVDLLNMGIASLTAEEIMRITPLMTSFITSFAISFILLALILFFTYTLTRCLIWCTIEKKKFTSKYFKKSLLLNLTWLPIILIITIAVSLIMSLLMLGARSTNIILLVYIASFISLIIFLILLNINFLVYHFFTKENKIFLSIGNAFKLLFKKFRKFITPLIFMVIVLFIILLPFSILSYKAPFAAEKYSIIQVLIIAFYLAWLRLYLVDLVKKEA